MSIRPLRAAVAFTAATAAVTLAAVTPAQADFTPVCPATPVLIDRPNVSVIVGTSCAENIIVGPNTNWVFAGGGNDSVLVGNDAVIAYLGVGNDSYEGHGQSIVYGEDGDDLIRSDAHADPTTKSGFIEGGDGNDDIAVMDGSWARGGDGDDSLWTFGKSGCGSSVKYGKANDYVPDFTNPGAYCQVLVGDAGNDTFRTYDHQGDATRGSALLHGGPGDDTYLASQPLALPARVDFVYEAADAGIDKAVVNFNDKVGAEVEAVHLKN
ncbi:MAG: calcium-binding protein [Acidimicrobiales bacterium]|nr:calcium-binding protein [Acidimicrobiales bacterium]